MYRCPKCKSEDLVVIECVMSGAMQLNIEDGTFSPDGETLDEIVLCQECGYTAPLSEFEY